MNEETRSKIMTGVKNAMNKYKIKLLRDIKEATPVDTGLMRNSITIINEKSNGGFTVHNPVEYASYLEEGTSRINVGSVENPRRTWEAKNDRQDTGLSTMPFMRPSVYKNRKWLAKTIAEEIRKVFA